MSKKHFSFDARDYDFMQSLSSAVLEEHPKQFRWVIFFWFISITFFLAWATFSPIDESFLTPNRQRTTNNLNEIFNTLFDLTQN